MVKSATVTLIRDGDSSASSILNKFYDETVRGFDRIEWAPHHVVFYMTKQIEIAYKADRVHELVTYYEEE